MSPVLDIEAQRLENLKEKQRLLAELNLHSSHRQSPVATGAQAEPRSRPPAKKRRLETTSAGEGSRRTSARIAASGTRRSYYGEENHPSASSSSFASDQRPTRASSATEDEEARPTKQRTREGRRASSPPLSATRQRIPGPSSTALPADLPSLLDHWNSWTFSAGDSDNVAAEPTLQANGTYLFASHPRFTPNKSPLAILQEGAFGGALFSPWRSATLALTLHGDHVRTLPAEWRAQLRPEDRYLTSSRYRAELNKHGVASGQTLAQWEAAGWINFAHDPRGWFEWYIRFWLGRRLADGEDERQVGRWERCVGPRGRWKRLLLKKYVEMGVRSVFDDEDVEGEGEGENEDEREGERMISPVMHQTCLHWAYQVCQEDLDEAWRERGARG